MTPTLKLRKVKSYSHVGVSLINFIVVQSLPAIYEYMPGRYRGADLRVEDP
jgi:hypothetical protein